MTIRGIQGWRAVACAVVVVLAVLAGCVGDASAVESISLLSGPLVVSGSPTEAEQLKALEEARLTSPEAVAAREESRTKYEGLSGEQAEKVDGEAFPSIVNEPSGGPPKLSAGQSITAYPASNVAQVALLGGTHGVIESTQPMAIGTPGDLQPIDLGLSQAGGGFEPGRPLVAVRIPKQLGAGVLLGSASVSLTPVDAQDAVLGGAEGAIDGASVLYANTQTDSDTLVKPTTFGFEADTVLRSVDSPEQLYFKVGLPEGATLVQASGGSGAVEVVREGVRLAAIPAPRAHDALGSPVRVSTSVSKDTLILTVPHRSGSWTYPIAVDPEVEDTHTVGSEGYHWQTETNGVFEPREEWESEAQKWAWRDQLWSGNNPAGRWGSVFYTSQGESHIFKFYSETSSAMPSYVENRIGIIGKSGWEPAVHALPSSYGNAPHTYCAVESTCASSGGSAGNVAQFVQYAVESGSTEGHSDMWKAAVWLEQEKGATTELDTKDPTLPFGESNLLYTNQWVKPTSSAGIQAFGSDPGVGVYGFKFSSPTSPEWKGEWPGCGDGAICSPSATGLFGLHGLMKVERGNTWSWCSCTDEKTLKEGNNTVELTATDSMGLTDVITTHIKVDGVAPYNITVAGLPSAISELVYPLSISATDGSGSIESSGVASINVAVDGRELGNIGAHCSPGPCTATGGWNLNGNEFGVGEHKLKVTATDYAGNVESKEFGFTVRHATPVPLGPGAVNPQSGEYGIGATDVSIGAPGGSLTVKRSYRSRRLTAGVEGPLGPQWSLSVGGQESITRLTTGNVTLTAVNGGQTTFTSNGKGGFTAPNGDSNLALSEVKNEKGELTEYVLKNTAGSSTVRFTSTGGPTSTLWKVSKEEGPLATQVVRYVYQTVEGVTEPVEALAPEPAGVSCGHEVNELKSGCRALTFEYAKKTKENIGEKRSEWGEYAGRLSKVFFHAANPSSKTMEQKAVAEYVYDKQGRLRAEWDPRVESSTDCGTTCSALPMAYGYDAEGHLTALTPPGQESWAFVYGAGAGDPNAGRLLKVARAPVSAPLWGGEAPKNTEAPKLSGTPAVGVRMAVSEGLWSNSPVVYGYQWQDCNGLGGGCTPILGATNANYTPTSSDVGHTLVAQVTAINGGGGVAAASAASGVVSSTAGAYTQTIDSGYSLQAVTCVPSTADCVTTDSQGKALYATNVSSSSAATWNSWSGPSGVSPGDAVDCPASSLCLLADGSKEGAGGNLYYATSLGGSWSEAYAPAYGVDAISCVSTTFCVDGQDGAGYFRYSISPSSTSWTLEDQGSAAMKSVFCLSSSFCVIGAGNGALYVANSTTQIESSTWKETDVDGTTALNGVACTSASSCVAVDGAGNVLNLTIESSGTASTTKHDIDGTNDLTAVTCTSSTCVAVDSVGNVFVSENKGETWTKRYALGDDLTSVSCASASLCAAVDTVGKITGLSPSGKVPEGEARSPQPGSTVEYGIPVSGSSAPYKLTKEEVEKWAQTDDPVEGMAVFPPDEPQGWPSSGHKHASIIYLDGNGRTVNAVSPSGGIATSEYNSTNDVVRTLGADNRAAALKETCETKEKCKSAEVAKLLDTQSTYNTTGSEPGTELLSTLGPQHTVMLAHGRSKENEEVQARAHTVYSYNEGVPTEGGPYRLVTKVVQSAKIEGEEKEYDPRTTTTSYSGQSNLGWKLRKPTSVVGDPSGLKQTTATVYDPQTGNVVETRRGASAVAPTYASGFGQEAGAPGKFDWPKGMTVDSKGNIWVSDTYNHRVQEFTATGGFVRQFGEWGSGNGQMEYPVAITVDGKGNVWIVDQGDDRVEEFSETGAYIAKYGAVGKGNGQFESPEGIAVDRKGNVWVVDSGNNRVQELNEHGEYVAQFGTEGTGNGQFKSPRRIAIDSKANIWVSDGKNCRVQEFNEKLEFVRTFGTCGKENGQLNNPQSIRFDSSGHLWVADENNDRVEEFSETGTYLAQFGKYGTGDGQLWEDEDLAFESEGNMWVLDPGNSRLQKFSISGTYITQFGSHGEPPGALYKPRSVAVDSQGNAWVADTEKARIVEFSPTGEDIFYFGAKGTGPGQFEFPRAITIDSKGNLWVVDQHNNRVMVFNTKGELLREFGTAGTENGQLKEPQGIALDNSDNAWIADTGNNRIEEFSETGTYLNKFGSVGTGKGQFKEPKNLTFDASGNIWVSDYANHKVQELTSTGGFIREFGGWGTAPGQFEGPQGIAMDSAGNVWVVDSINGRVEEFSNQGEYINQFGSTGSGQGQFNEPHGITLDSKGNAWIVDTNNNRIEQWTVATPSSDEHTAYYTAATNNGHPACGGHPEWANMPCQTAPVAQPGTVGLPTLPVTTVAYNMYGQPTSATSTVNECVKVSPGAGKYTNSTCTTTGSGEYETKTNTRTTTIGYDTIGRPEMSETTATTGTALPKVTDKYSATTGMPIEQATSTESIKSAYNALGQLTSYTDASGKTTTSEYEGEGKYAGEKELDGRPRAVNDGQGTETYTYNETTGTLSKLAISGAGAFTASYDIEGNMLGVHYPDGMSATYTYNATGKPTNLVYDKETHCTEGCEWFKDSVVPSIHGQWATQRSSLGTDTYTYDATGRLIEATQTPTGKGCATRRYTYDEDTNRTSLTAYSPNSKNECSTTSGSSEEKHSYDEADRLTDAGVAYEPFGETTKLPATDAGGSELVSTFYADGQLREQKQGEGAQAQAIGYTLDPADRTGEVVSTGKVVATETLHYNGPASTPSWTSEPSGKTTRMMSAMSGLVAIQHGSETPTLQLANLHGDIVGTAEDSETANKLASTILEPTEYGVPATEAPPKYSWLGAHELPTELPSGVIAMGVRSYVPKLGRFLQTDPVAGGSANAYAYVFGDPVNETDLTGADGMPAWLIEANNHEALELTEAATARRIEAEERKAAEEAAARAAAQAAAEAAARAAATAAITAESPYGESYEEEWGEEEWGEEEGEEEWEYVSDHHNADSGYKEAHIEPGLLVQRLTTNSTVPLCNASSEGPCVRTVSGHKKRRHKGHHCDLQFQACVKCPPGYEEIPIGGEKCFPSAPPDSGSSNSKKEWWEGGIMVSGYRRR